MHPLKPKPYFDPTCALQIAGLKQLVLQEIGTTGYAERVMSELAKQFDRLRPENQLLRNPQQIRTLVANLKSKDPGKWVLVPAVLPASAKPKYLGSHPPTTLLPLQSGRGS